MIYQSKEGETPLDDLSELRVRIPNITRAQLDVAEAENIQQAILKYINPRRIRRFDTKFFQTLHASMFGDVWEWAGTFRTSQTNIGSAPVSIQQDLIILERDLDVWPHTLESAVRLHHRAVLIHPFMGGNGRWSRLLSDLWLQKHAKQSVLWPEGLEKDSEIRDEYLKALHEADKLSYEPLLNLHKRYLTETKRYFLPPR